MKWLAGLHGKEAASIWGHMGVANRYVQWPKRATSAQVAGNVEAAKDVGGEQRNITSGATQKLKRGVIETSRRLAPLQLSGAWLHTWMLMGCFAGMAELTSQAEGGAWSPTQPYDLMYSDVFCEKAQRPNAMS